VNIMEKYQNLMLSDDKPDGNGDKLEVEIDEDLKEPETI